MSFLHRNGLMLRGLAVVLTAYAVLASGRALVPGLCATLADAESAACCEPKPSCCHDDASEGAVFTTAPHPCAFCTLVHTAAQPVALEIFQAPAVSTPRFLVAHDHYVADPTSAGCFLRRAPPLA